MQKLEVKKTTYLVQGCTEPCIIVKNKNNNPRTYVRISNCYHFIGSNSLFIEEFIDGDLNAGEEYKGNFANLTDLEAIKLAKDFSVYI